jgi:zinc/manganese transport system substrate-binding protein
MTGAVLGITVLLGVSACSSGSDSSAGNGLPTSKPAASTAAGTADASATATADATTTTTAGTGKIGIVAAENFWGNITSQIGGAKVDVTSIISDPNADPHEYETSAKDAAALARAGFVIENGVGYDDFVDKLLAASPKADREVLNVSKVVGVSGSNPNPHLWYNPQYVTEAAAAIEAQLVKEDPADAALFKANLATFQQGEQTQVVGVIDQIKAKYSGDKIAYTERVPGYLILAAGLQLGTPASFSQSVEDGDDPSPGDNAAFQIALKDKKVKVLLYNSQVTSPTTQKIRQLATSSGVPIVGVSETMPLTAVNFQTWQGDQAKALLAALGG